MKSLPKVPAATIRKMQRLVVRFKKTLTINQFQGQISSSDAQPGIH